MVAQITEPREPCVALNRYGNILGLIYDRQVRARNMRSKKWGLSGFYAEVIREGVVSPGQEITLVDPCEFSDSHLITSHTSFCEGNTAPMQREK